MANEVQAVRLTRREYSAELKAQVVQACRQPGASVASVAMAHGIYANIVHRWLREPSCALAMAHAPAFVPISLTPPKAQPTDHAPPAGASDIHIEVRRATSVVTVSWPLDGAAACAQWLRDWLKRSESMPAGWLSNHWTCEQAPIPRWLG
jgi:transposase